MRWVSWVLPTGLLALLLGSWFRWATPLPVVGARLFGGPLIGARHVSARLELLQDEGSGPRPVAGARTKVRVRGPRGGDAAWSGTTDDAGMAWVELDLPQALEGEARVEVVTGGAPAVEHELRVLSSNAWNPREQGGELHGARSGDLSLDVAPRFGVFAVPFTQSLTVSVNGASAVDVEVSASLEGRGNVQPASRRAEQRDGKLVAEFSVTPEEHTLALQLRATTLGEETSRTGGWYGPLPVVPGAIALEPRGPRDFLVQSATPRQRAYVAVVDAQTRLWATAVDLEADGRGGARGTLSLPASVPLADALWAVVSSAVSLDAPATVGWPIGAGHRGPPVVRTVGELLLADTFTAARLQERGRQVKNQRWLFFAALLSGGLSAAWMLLGVHRARVDISRRLAEVTGSSEESARLLEEQSGRMRAYALLLVVLFGAVGVWFLIYWQP